MRITDFRASPSAKPGSAAVTCWWTLSRGGGLNTSKEHTMATIKGKGGKKGGKGGKGGKGKGGKC